jgi:CAAX protease family protein
VRFPSHWGVRDAPESREAEGSDGLQRLRFLVLLYLLAIVLAEVCVVFVDVAIGVLAEALVVLASLNHYLFAAQRSGDAAPREPGVAPLAVLLVIPLVPLLRILSVTMVVPDVQELYQYTITGIPLLLGAVLIARAVRSRHIVWRPVEWRSQGMIAAAGLPLGAAAFLVVRPESLDLSWSEILLGTLSLTVAAALTEEFIFRGLLQESLSRLFGEFAVLLSTVAFVTMYLAVRPVAYLVIIGLAGLLFAWAVERTGSLVGVVLAHGLMNVGLVLVWPWVAG